MMAEEKSGYFSSPFVLCFVTIVLTLLVTFGTSLLNDQFFEPGSHSQKIATATLQALGVLSAGLTAAGYTLGNAIKKAADAKAEAAVTVASEAKQTAQIEKNKAAIDLEAAKANLQASALAASPVFVAASDPPRRTPGGDGIHIEG
jgi:hypothetical protein